MKIFKEKDNTRISRLRKNTISPLCFRVLTIIFGLILPRLYLKYYGSVTNGLINSISQFLNIISLLELGIGTIVESALYKPLAEKNISQISAIVVSAKKFYRFLANILLIYVVILIFTFPHIVHEKYSLFYTGFLIVSMSIGLFANYYFGIINNLLINADQRGYVQYNVQIVILVLNSAACIIMITHGVNIQIVKLLSGVLYLIRPIYLYYYVQKNYEVNWNQKYDADPLEQKWNGIAQHVANLVLENTDVIVLTLFASLSTVSIYSIYSMIVSSLERIFSALTNGILALWGELWARNEFSTLKRQFRKTEWAINNITIFIYGCTYVLIIPFIQVYTRGITDENYVAPQFAILITLAYLIRCLQRPYTTLCFATNKYKDTQWCYIVTALINILISVVFVKEYGLIGVAIGTLCAMMFELIWMMQYCYRKILCISILPALKVFLFDGVVWVFVSIISKRVALKAISYVSWGIMALKVAFIWMIILCIANYILYKKYIRANSCKSEADSI